MKTDRPIAQPGWVRRGFIAWLWELVAIMLMLVVQTFLHSGATINLVMYYVTIPVYIFLITPWVIEGKFPWQLWREWQRRELD